MIYNLKKRNWQKMYYQYRVRNDLIGQNGFFEGALYSTFDVDEMSWPLFIYNPLKYFSSYDAVVVNQKSSITPNGIKKLARHFRSTPKILFASESRANRLPENGLLDYFDLIFKREPLKDLDRYEQISTINKEKIRPTMLSCPLLEMKKEEARKGSTDKLKLIAKINEPDAKKYDFSFAGKGTSIQRYDVCNSVAGLGGYTYYLTIFNPLDRIKPDFIAPAIASKKFNHSNYTKMISQTRINLALEGIGQFTHRHLELWCMGAFSLSSPSIREVQLPHGNHLEGEHYVAFDNLDDLHDKIKYYLEHENERMKIAKASQKLFQQIYDFKKHGQFIKDCFSGSTF